MVERLIDAEALEKEIHGIFDMTIQMRAKNEPSRNPNEDAVYRKIEELFIFSIKNQPTIDATPIVYCKDCVLRGTEDCAMYYESDYFDVDEQYSWETDNDFCSWGRRAEE